MEKINYVWRLYNDGVSCEIRYCHNCGIKTIFTDSMKRRQNANGKDIYAFAIYKCSNGHTWNKNIGSSEMRQRIDVSCDEKPEVKLKVDFINLKELEKCGVKEVEIYLQEIEGQWRLDKLLAQQIKNSSRNQIERMISCKNVLVNAQFIKPSKRLKSGDTITIILPFS